MTLIAGSLEELAETLGQKASDDLGFELTIAGVLPDRLLVVDNEGKVFSVEWGLSDEDELTLGEAKTVEGAEAESAVLAATERAGLSRVDPPGGTERPGDPTGTAKITSGLPTEEAKSLGLEVEGKGAYVEIPGSWESMLSDIRDAVTDLLVPPLDPDTPQSEVPANRPWVSVVATFDDYVLARMTSYNDGADDTTYWQIPWSPDDDGGDPTLGTPVGVDLQASIVPRTEALESDDPTPPAEALGTPNAEPTASGTSETKPNAQALATALALLSSR